MNVRDVSTNIWMSRECGRAWACLHASQRDVGARLVDTRMHGWAETSDWHARCVWQACWAGTGRAWPRGLARD
ncbi:hypothetical protein CRG98_020526 [Punica granatum]|uniref:Uncharacterized protein n=1 Tax=Punica granatum TaxID=22663 RepID=A0A2I0JS54_PUNGR|nr:hypothetical protein CRG98_020526 [Punica granatum]